MYPCSGMHVAFQGYHATNTIIDIINFIILTHSTALRLSIIFSFPLFLSIAFIHTDFNSNGLLVPNALMTLSYDLLPLI